MAKKQQLLFELDAPGLSPETVDSLLLLRLAESWLRALTKVAEAGNFGLTFRGLEVRHKCVRLMTTPSNARAAQLAANRTLRIVGGKEYAPRGAEGAVADMRWALRVLPPDHKVMVKFGKWSRAVTAPNLPVAEIPWETTELRVMPMRLNARAMTVELVSDSEDAPFIVHVDKIEQMRAIGAAIKSEMDVVIDVARDVDGRIERGRIVEIERVIDENPVVAWRTWAADNTSAWDEVDDVAGELGRYH